MSLIKRAKVIFSNVKTVDSFSGVYQVVIELSKRQAEDLYQEGVNISNKKTESGYVDTVKIKSKFQPRVVGLDGQTDISLKGELGPGSLVSIQYATQKGKDGASAKLLAVQVLKAEELPVTLEFDDERNNITFS